MRKVSLGKIQEKREKLLRQIRVPIDGLPGSLSVSRLRCGKKECHCNSQRGHENWTLTYMSNGKKRVKHIPLDLVERVRERVEQGKAFKQDINEIFGANVELLVLLRKDKKRRKE